MRDGWAIYLAKVLDLVRSIFPSITKSSMKLTMAIQMRRMFFALEDRHCDQDLLSDTLKINV